MVFAVIGGLCALLLRSHVKEARRRETERDRPRALAADAALAETAAAEADGV